MPLKVSFELGDADLQHLAEVAQVRQSAARSQPAERIITAARDVYLKGVQAHLADFVRERYSRLGTMLEMVDDAEWRLSQEDSQRLDQRAGVLQRAGLGRVLGAARPGHHDRAGQP